MENILCPHCGCPLRFVGVTDIDVEDCGTLYEIYDGKCFTCNKKYTWTKYQALALQERKKIEVIIYIFSLVINQRCMLYFQLITKRTVKECIIKGKWNNKKYLINS